MFSLSDSFAKTHTHTTLMLSVASAKNLGLSFSLGYCKPVIDLVLNYESHHKSNYDPIVNRIKMAQY